MPAKIFYDQDADLGLLKGKKMPLSAMAARDTPTP
jgi:Ketol-acid reductoisomerase